MILTRPLCCFDVETTGVDPATDAIVEFACVRLEPGTNSESFCQRFKPWKTIPKEVEELTGITNDEVKDFDPFKKWAARLLLFVNGCDLVGFNLANFDIPILWEEFYRCGIEWSLDGVHVVDCGAIFKIREPRDLTGALAFYCGMKHKAHEADSDVDATMKVLKGQMHRYADLSVATVEQLAAASKYKGGNRVDLAGKITKDKDGDYCFQVGTPRGRKVKDDISFAHWMLQKDFSEQTKMVVRRIIKEIENGGKLLL